jgi:peptidoglycan/xylan/chitin deacetylase (PgdA/CDA1 family)
MVDRLLVLGWHNVHGTPCFSSGPGKGERGLRHQLTTLRRLAHVVPLERALRALDNGDRLPPRAVALTFDDGYRDNLDVAAPILRDLGLPATFFLVPELLDRTTPPWWERVAWAFGSATASGLDWDGTRYDLSQPKLASQAGAAVSERLKAVDGDERREVVEDLVERLAPAGSDPSSELFMTWQHARELVRMDFEIGSHTMRHDILSQEPSAAQAADLVAARQTIQDRLQVGADVLAYPNGRSVDYDQGSLDAAAAAGHSHALTTEDGFNTPGGRPYEVRRSVVYPERDVVDLLKSFVYARRADRQR